MPIMLQLRGQKKCVTTTVTLQKISFLGKVFEHVMVGQPQMFLKETDYLFQSGFKLGFGAPTALAALTDDLLWGNCGPVYCPRSLDSFGYH